MTNNDEDIAPRSANPGYAAGEVVKALATQAGHEDPAVRQRAGDKVLKWLAVWRGMLSGRLNIGSRQPMTDTPIWATLEVMKGGFASGGLLAGGKLQTHEIELCDRLGLAPNPDSRVALNEHYLSDAGAEELMQMLDSGLYRIDVPEEGALLAVAYLVTHSNEQDAAAILTAIQPYFGKLRFYPRPAPTQAPSSEDVFVQPLSKTLQNLAAIRTSTSILAQREAIDVWTQLTDRAVELFAETVAGDAPELETGADGKPIRDAGRRYAIRGGWPCQVYADDWRARARAVIDDYRKLRKEHTLCRKPDRKGENFTLLRQYLEKCVDNPQSLNGREVGMIRLILASINTRRGLPNSERCKGLRTVQQAIAAKPSAADLARPVLFRLGDLPREDGLTDPDAFLYPVTTDEARQFRLPEGEQVDFLRKKLILSLTAPVERLIELGVISSAEVLAVAIPQITAHVAAAPLTDPVLRRLYASVYQAFRRRRSLLLLNLESQVRLSDLPWMTALNPFIGDSSEPKELATRTLREVCVFAVTGFPYQILPNKLLREIEALAKTAELNLPIVDELAADIFMRAFGLKFLRSAHVAAGLLRGTLYERYYGLDYARVAALDDASPAYKDGPKISRGFFDLCNELSVNTGAGSYVAQNGTIIEQEQILTTHNLAVLFVDVDLRQRLASSLLDLAKTCFEWTCARFQQMPPGWQQQLRVVKNAAYAWRQTVFFLALLPDPELVEFADWANEHFSSQREAFQNRFRPAMNGLLRAIEGLPVDDAASREDSRRFLGWSTGVHWFLREAQ